MSDVHRVAAVDPVDAALAELASGPRPFRVVDVGGGSGTRAVPLAGRGCQVTVVDRSGDALAMLRRRASEAGVDARVTGVQADADQLATVVPPGQADLVICHRLLETVDDPMTVLGAIAQTVRPGGRVSVVVESRLGAVLRLTVAGRLGEARAALTDPHGRSGPSDPVRRRFGSGDLADLLTRVDLHVDTIMGVGTATTLSVGGRQTQPHDDVELDELDALLSVHQTLREIAPALHVVARRAVRG